MATVKLNSEVTGSVWKILVQTGQKLEPGATIMILESMKMEIPVITEDAGTVKEILVKPKDPVAEGQVVAILEE